MILIFIVMAALIFGAIKLINYLFGWRKKFNYLRGLVEIWYNDELVHTFMFFDYHEQEALDNADRWIEENRERIEKYCK